MNAAQHQSIAINRADAERALDALDHIEPPLERDQWVKLLMSAHDAGVSEDDARAWSERGENFDAADFRATWRSIKPGAVTSRTLFRAALDAGWNAPPDSKTRTKAEIEKRQVERAARLAQAAAQKAEDQARAAQTAQRLWNAAAPAIEHPYLTRKGVNAHGLRVGKWERVDEGTGEVIVTTDRALLIPIVDSKRKLHSLQAIHPEQSSKKLYLRNGAKRGHFHPIGKPQRDAQGRMVFVLGEGYATCASVHECTGHVALVCFDTSNLMAVAQALRAKQPEAVILFAADNDRETAGNPGVTAARKAAGAVGGRVAVPVLAGMPEKAVDFNDLHAIEGAAVVRAVIDDALALAQAADEVRILPVWLVPPTSPTDLQRAAFAADIVAMFDAEISKRLDPRGVLLRPYDGIDGLRSAMEEVSRFMPSAKVHAIVAAELAAEATRMGGCSVEVLPPGASWVDDLWAAVTERTGLQAPTARALAEQVAGAQEVVDAQPKDEVKVLAPTAPATREIALVNPQEIDAIENSDDALALQFVECAGNFRWSPGLGWMIDNGVTWSRDDAMHRFDLARRVCRAVAATCGPKAEAEAKRISSAKTVNATVTLAQSDRQMVVPTSEWDADPLLLNTPGGVVDLRTGKMRERGIEYVTQTAMVAPDFSAECPTWLRFLQQVFLDDATMIEFMQRSMGYWLSGSVREQVIHFLHGQGSNGKSVLSDLVKWIVGSYGVKLTATALMQSRGERHPTELAQLRGKRLALSSELGEHDYFNEALLKELTGDATLSARFMRGDFFEFQMSQKHLIVGNFKPRLRGGDPAIARRMLLVPFNATFKGAAKDMGLLDKLKAEAPAIVAWMVQGAVKWHAEGLAIPESVRAASADYMAAMDDLGLWMGECCEMTGEAKAKDLYASFSAWKKARGENAPSQTIWGERMTAHPGITRRTSNGVRYAGIRLTAVEAGIQVPSDEAWGGVGDAVSAQFGSYSDIRG